jgi:hypothetical protein
MLKKILALALVAALSVPSASLAAKPEKPAEQEYIITFEEQEGNKKALKVENKIIKKYVTDEGGSVVEEGKLVHYLIAKLTPKQAEKIAKKKGIEAVEENKPTYTLQAANLADPYMTPELTGWGYDEIKSNIGLNGEGVKVLVADSGMGNDHPDVDVEGRASFYYDDVEPYEEEGWGAQHGTTVGSVIAAKDNGFGVTGVAPNVRLFSYKVTTSTGMITPGAVVGAIDYALDNGMDILNMSISGGTTFAVEDAIIEADNAGLLMIAAAGNDGDDIDNSYTAAYPAEYPQVVAVSAAHSDHDLAGYSNYGNFVDFIGPAAIPAARNARFAGTDNWYAESVTGTSFAAPMVSAVAALTMQAYPNYSQDEIINELESNAVSYGLPVNQEGHGAIRPPSTKSPYLLEDINHGLKLYASRAATYPTAGSTQTIYSRAMDDPAYAGEGAYYQYERPHARPFEDVTIRHRVYSPSGAELINVAQKTGTDGRFDYSFPIDSRFSTKGQYKVVTATSYTDPATGEYCYDNVTQYFTIQ